MTPPTKTVQHACRVIRRQVRFTDARLSLRDTQNDGDIKTIRRATWLYVETWIVPILDAIECGDTYLLRQLVRNERGHELGRKPANPEA